MTRTTRGRRTGRLVAAIATSGALLLSACGGSSLNEAPPAAEGSTAPCGEVNMAMNAWVGYTASASVVSYVAENELGCTVNQKDLNEQVAWQGFESGEVDVIIENWAHADLKKKYIDEQKVAEIAGKNGNVGQIGWFVPPWMAEKYPDILDWQNLNKYADLFKTGESGDKGQLLDGDPAFVTNDAALVKNLDLNYEVVYSGSEAALITAFRDAEQNKKPMLGYFYSPQWFLAEVPLKMVKLPEWTEGCDTDAEAVKCGYPEDQLDKIISTRFAQSGSPAVALVKNFSWTNDDQNEVALSIAKDKLSPEEAAKKWVEANPDKVNAWLGR
jgi:glycine betaine/proline transport system substrate-binding protein